MTKQREKENKEEKNTYLKEPNHSEEISKMIDDTIKSKHKVWLASDWHLWIFDKGTKKICKRSDFDKIIENINKSNEDDMLIFLGDLVDGEFTDKDELKKILLQLPPKNKVMVRGNNDLFDTNFYRGCGFKYCVYKFIWKNILFSHAPLEHDNSMNIHGHIHYDYKTAVRKATYWVPYNNHICVFDKNRSLQELKDVIKNQVAYSKHVRVDEEKCEELRDKIENGIFEYVMDTYLRYDD